MTATPNIERVMARANTTVSGLSFQLYNHRHIKNDPRKPWSQHAGCEPAKGWWGNAVDIFGTKAKLDAVHKSLLLRKVELRINNLIWWTEDHYDHIHADTWPQMWDFYTYTPPPPGRLVTYDRDGSRYNTFDIDEVEELGEMNTLKRGDKGNAVHKLQVALNGFVDVTGGNQAPLKVDGHFGPATESRVKDYQIAADLREVTGVGDGVTVALLMEYVADKVVKDHGLLEHDHSFDGVTQGIVGKS